MAPWARGPAVFTTTDDGWRTARDLVRAGVAVEAVIDTRAVTPLRRFAGRAERRAGSCWAAASPTPMAARASKRIDSRSTPTARAKASTVDLLAVSGGWNPQVGLTTHLGARPVWNNDIHAFVPGEPPPGLTVAGAAAGRLSLGECLTDGARAGAEAAAALGFKPAGRAPSFDAES